VISRIGLRLSANTTLGMQFGKPYKPKPSNIFKGIFNSEYETPSQPEDPSKSSDTTFDQRRMFDEMLTYKLESIFARFAQKNSNQLRKVSEFFETESQSIKEQVTTNTQQN
jgi:hypothetical protein